MEAAADTNLARRDFKFSGHECSILVRKDLQGLFPERDIESEPLYVVALSHATVHDMQLWSEEIENERCSIYNKLILTAIEMANKLKDLGYWADFIDPYSGKPYLSPWTNETLFEVDERMSYFGFRLADMGCCKCLIHPEYGSRAVVGLLFTTATLTNDLLEQLAAL
uniref:Aminotransferase class I/classII domain-containing protein n=1 Tax=Trichuris muris TaxID=70415 RepID=A0A5S6QMT0_TRIMR